MSLEKDNVMENDHQANLPGRQKSSEQQAKRGSALSQSHFDENDPGTTNDDQDDDQDIDAERDPAERMVSPREMRLPDARYTETPDRT